MIPHPDTPPREEPPPGTPDRDRPGPLMRRGPRPLLLHLMLATLKSSDSVAMSPPWKADWPPPGMTFPRMNPFWEDLCDGLANGRLDDLVTPDRLADAVQRNADLIHGIAAYRRHPWRRDLLDPPTIWTEGDSRLLDYGGTGPTVLVVPSLVNRAYVVDLGAEWSMLRWLAARGVRPVLLDWGWPGEAERRFTLTDYVAGRLERAMAALPGPLVLAGYCMGGLLTLAAALRRPEQVRALALLATPWDFHAGTDGRGRHAESCLALLEPVLSATHTLPVDVLQALFASLDPWGVGAKYRAFARLDQTSRSAERFVALEDWLNDGVPLAEPVARACLAGWYGRNEPALGSWRIAGLPVDPSQLRCPTFVVVPGRDRIVPPESAGPLVRLIQGAVLHEPRAGHVGMVAGPRAEAELWQPLLTWLQGLGGPPRRTRRTRRTA